MDHAESGSTIIRLTSRSAIIENKLYMYLQPTVATIAGVRWRKPQWVECIIIALQKPSLVYNYIGSS